MTHFIEDVNDIWNVSNKYDVEPDVNPAPDGIHPDPGTSENDIDENTAITIILIIFSFVGALGNGLVLYVFTRSTVKLTSTIFILALAGTDFVTCMFIIPYTVYVINVNYFLLYDVACKVYQFLITCNVPLSAFIMVAIAVDRYICICHPFVHIMTVKRAKIIVGILASFAVLLGLITSLGFSVYKVKTVTDPPVNITNQLSNVAFETNDNITVDDPIDNIYPKYMQSPNNQYEIDAQSMQSLQIQYSGQCELSPTLLPSDFIQIYQKIYSLFYLFSLLVVLVLYAIIYSSVTKQRAKRRKQKIGSNVKQVNTQCQTDESTMPLNVLNNHINTSGATNMKLKVEIEGETVSTRLSPSNKEENGIADSESHPINRVPSRKQSPPDANRERKDHNRLANIKTAVMLFIVSVVFIIAFLPAWLMAHRLLHYNAVVFYMYFSYNVGNPVIYAFLNQMFREKMCKILSSCRGYCNFR